MARMQKALTQSRQYSHQDQSQDEWSNLDSDNEDPNNQPFQ